MLLFTSPLQNNGMLPLHKKRAETSSHHAKKLTTRAVAPERFEKNDKAKSKQASQDFSRRQLLSAGVLTAMTAPLAGKASETESFNAEKLDEAIKALEAQIGSLSIEQKNALEQHMIEDSAKKENNNNANNDSNSDSPCVIVPMALFGTALLSPFIEGAILRSATKDLG